jgi:hypothetical protein
VTNMSHMEFQTYRSLDFLKVVPYIVQSCEKSRTEESENYSCAIVGIRWETMASA